VAPTRCYLPAQIFPTSAVGRFGTGSNALRSSEDWGIGDFGHLQALVGGLASRGADVVGVNPLHALFLDMPDDASPYSPSSRLFRNSLYLDVTGRSRLRAVRRSGRSHRRAGCSASNPDGAGCHLRGLQERRCTQLGVLECLFRSFDKRGAEHKAAFKRFRGPRRPTTSIASRRFQMLSEHLGTHDWSALADALVAISNRASCKSAVRVMRTALLS